MSSEEDTPAPQPATATAAQGSFHTGGLAGVGGAAEGGYRDKEPAPSYDGVSPETTFRQYEKNIRLWQFESDVPARKQGVKMMRSLTGLARLAVDDMEFEEIACESGTKNVLAKLRDYFLPHLEVSLPRAFEAAVYGNARALSESQEQRVLTWCEGSYNRDEIIKALRRLDKVVRDGGKSSKASYVQENVEAFAVEAENGEEEDSEDGEHIFLADGDLDQVYEENEVKEALASYRETRQALKALRTNRGYFPNGYKKDGFKGFGKGKSKGKRKVHVEQLKLRSRCWNCGAVGHWSEECKQPRTGVARGPPSSSGGSSNTGFYVAASKKDEPRALEGEVLEEEGEQSRSFWLRSFVEEQRSNLATSGAFDSASSSAYKERRSRGKETGGFCGIVTKPSQGIVDTAAEGGLIGEVALKRHDSELRRFGLKCKWIPKVSSAKGVGGSAKVVGVTLIPVGIGGINGILEATVVEGEVPLLLPIGMLKTLGAVIDLQNDVMRLRNHNITVDLETMSSGHVAVDVTSFEDGEFQVLHEAGCHGEFHLPPCNNSAMLAQLKKDNRNSKPEFLSHGVDFPASNGIADGKAAKCGAKWCTRASCGDATHASREASSSQLAGNHGQSDHFGHFGSASRCCKRLVSFAVGATAALGAGGEHQHHRGPLLPHHSGCKVAGALEEFYASDRFIELMHPPEEGVESWGECLSKLRGVQAMPFQVGMSSESNRAEEGAKAERGPLEQEQHREVANPRSDGGRRRRVGEEGDGEISGECSFKSTNSEVVGTGAEDPETRSKRERVEAGEDDAGRDGQSAEADDGSAAGSADADANHQSSVRGAERGVFGSNEECGSRGSGEVQLWRDGRTIGGEERRSQFRESASFSCGSRRRRLQQSQRE